MGDLAEEFQKAANELAEAQKDPSDYDKIIRLEKKYRDLELLMKKQKEMMEEGEASKTEDLMKEMRKKIQ